MTDRVLYLVLLVVAAGVAVFSCWVDRRARRARMVVEARDRRWRTLMWQIGQNTRGRWERD